MLNIPQLRSAALLAVSVLMFAAYTGASAEGQSKVESLIQEFNSTTHDLHKWQAAQVTLLQQKTSIDATAADLAKRQDALNVQMQAHNDRAEQQKQLLAKSRAECNNGGNNTSEHVNTCDNNIKKLNKQTAAMDAELLPLQTEQTSIDVAYTQYNQTANDWAVQEQRTTTVLNALYRSMNDWADRAEGLITSDPFQTEILAEHWGKSCPNRAMPSRVLSIDEVMGYANTYDKCLRYVESQRRVAASKGA
jgi:chromosome segregation ATPase